MKSNSEIVKEILEYRKDSKPVTSSFKDSAYTVLDVPYEDRKRASILGARWNRVLRKWCVSNDIDKAPFSQWLK